MRIGFAGKPGFVLVGQPAGCVKLSQLRLIQHGIGAHEATVAAPNHAVVHAVRHAPGGEPIAGKSAVAKRFTVERPVPLVRVTDRAQRVTHRTSVSSLLETGAIESSSRCQQPGWWSPSI